MRLSQRIALNTFALGATDIVGRILSFVLVVAIARHYAPETFGFYTFALSFVELLIVLADLGLSKVIVRDVAADPQKTGYLFGTLGTIKLIYSAFTVGAIALLLMVLQYPTVVIHLTIAFGLRSVFDSFSGFCASIFKAHQRMDLIPPLNIGGVALNVAFGFALLWADFEIFYIVCAFVLIAALKLSLSIWLVLKKFAKPEFTFRGSTLKSLAKTALPFGVGSFLVRISARLDTVMLSKLTTMVVVGYYNAAYNMVIVLLFLPGAFNEALFPVMSRFFKTSGGDFRMTIDRALKYSYILGIPMAAGVFVLADPIITLFYGPAYAASVLPLKILIWTLVSSFGTFVLTTALNSSRREILVTWIVLACCAVNALGNIILIPRFGAVGASITTVLTELCFFGLSLLAVRKYLFRPKVFRYLLKPLLASAMMYGAVSAIRDMFIAIPIVVGALTYAAAALILYTFDATDMALLKNLLATRKTAGITPPDPPL